MLSCTLVGSNWPKIWSRDDLGRQDKNNTERRQVKSQRERGQVVKEVEGPAKRT